MAERPRRRELGELDLCDDLGAQPQRVRGIRRRNADDRVLLGAQGGEQSCQTAQLALAEAGADAADVAEPSVRRDADEE